MSAGEIVHVFRGQRPSDYHCSCDYCMTPIGELRQSDGEYYSRLERRQYYSDAETRREDGSGHIAKTPLHIARWAIQQYTSPGDWVLDPTIGAGTTAVEALTQGRNVAGMELEYGSVLQANVKKTLVDYPGVEAQIASGDARNIESFLRGLDSGDRQSKRLRFQLVVNNPPYSGDVSAYPKRNRDGSVAENASYLYDAALPNLAFLKEKDEYWDTLHTIWQHCAERLVRGGHFVIGVKDMVRKGEPFLLHKELCTLLEDSMGLEFTGTAFLRHHPGTWHLNRALKEGNAAVAQYQTINVFKKV